MTGTFEYLKPAVGDAAGSLDGVGHRFEGIVVEAEKGPVVVRRRSDQGQETLIVIDVMGRSPSGPGPVAGIIGAIQWDALHPKWDRPHMADEAQSRIG